MAQKEKLIRDLYDAAVGARAQLGDLVREGKATDDDKESYEYLSGVLKEIETTDYFGFRKTRGLKP